MGGVTIIIPCYNQGLFLLETLGSVRILRDEGIADVIIVNDGSDETITKEIFKKLEGDGWGIIHQPNGGLASARNKAIISAKTEYILPLDSDNLIIPEFVIQALELMKTNPEVDIVYSDSFQFGEVEAYRSTGDFDPCRLISDNYIDACAIYKREVWQEIGGYDPNMPEMGHEDWDFWISALMRHKQFYYMPVLGFKYRVRSNSMLRSVTIKKGDENRNYIYSKQNLQLFESINLTYNPDNENYKRKYFSLIDFLKRKRVRSIVKIILGSKF